ncbi:type II toxin-antitoxin system RelE/ParE family toxin [Methylobacterium sp. SyP6R]|uniref:type II toxin-antitoxin system RelE/ParE family toxin n=1 Tax=Methylobacterium sp. SyP6R TaxID=2718876 RepID=UPI001F400C73|nr:type II toxin-antitoxin system RelE/ParE family toxin [Methylobacterium sp. SyP6R]MCF4129274.1 type II toxin-antitoxin system RelE/ParE family toxin [Methylobacterium sp. SyP6R]
MAIGIHNPDAAERLYDRLEQRAETLRQHPKMGPRRPDIRPTARVLVEPPYLILYEITPDTDDDPVDAIQIVAVLDGRKDLSLGI